MTNLTGRLLALDLRSLALLRIGVAVLTLRDLVDRARDLTEYYTDTGVLPRALLTREYWNQAWWSLHLSSGELSGQLLLFAVHALAALALLVGWRTRIASWSVYLLTVSLQNRNPLVLDGSDRLLLLLLFWGLFLPWEARFSLDARRCPRLAATPDVMVIPGAAAYLCQVCIVYFVAAYWKIHPVWLTERTAIYRSLELAQFCKPLGQFLMGYPGLLKMLTLGVVVLEWTAPFLLLMGNTVLRAAAVWGLVTLHVGIYLTMDLQSFPLVSMVSLMGCLPSSYWSDEPPRTQGDTTAVSWATGTATGLLAAFFLTGVMLWNAAMIVRNRVPPRSTNVFTVILASTRLTQFWDLFSPVPREVDSRYFLETRLADGRTIDLLRGGRPLSSASTQFPYREFKNQRQRVYLSTLEWSVDKDILMRYLRRQAVAWQQSHPGDTVLWTRLWSQRTQSRYIDVARKPQMVDLGWALPPHAVWQGPVSQPALVSSESR